MEKNPTANVAIKRNLLKQYQINNKKSYYLKDKTNFEIELFNPLSETIKCELKLNNKFEGAIVLRPGERVFLERYINSNNKFLFETYQVENSEEVKKAIETNGNIEILFYRESTYNYPFTNEFTYNDFHHYEPSSTSGTTLVYCSTEKIDTGIISKGKESEQTFTYTHELFEHNPFYKEKIKLLPDSYKINTSKDIKHKQYCAECGKKVSYKHNYCSYCGNKL